MKLFCKKYLSDLMAGSAVIIALMSCFYSCNANKISKSALNHTKEAYVQMMRPLLQIESTRRDDGVAIQYKREGNRIWFQIQLKVKNEGKTSAENIVCLKDHLKIEFLEKEVELASSTSSIIPTTRGPGQKFFFERKAWVKSDNPKQIDEILKEFLEGKVFITIDIAYEYTDSLKLKKYSVSGIYKIRRTNTTILDYKGT